MQAVWLSTSGEIRKERLHELPRQRTRKLLATVHSRRVDREIATTIDVAPSNEEAEKRSNTRHSVLQSRSRKPSTQRTHEHFDLSWAYASKHCGIAIEAEKFQQLGRIGAVV
jgi:hypothetical protein